MTNKIVSTLLAYAKRFAFIIVLVYCFTKGWALWLLLVTTAYIFLRYRKPLWEQMKAQGEAYAEMLKPRGSNTKNENSEIEKQKKIAD